MGRGTGGQQARQPAGLVHVSDEEPGITRRRAGRGFTYRTASGKVVSATERARIHALVIPPAWTEVWISPDPRGHLQATGRDVRGRKQYRYHPRWTETRDAHKFDHLLEFATALPKVRRAVARDLRGEEPDRDRVVALVVRLLETSLVRVGNEEYARTNGSYGLTTLRTRHAHVSGTQVELVFRGKHGREHHAVVEDRRVARAVRACRELPGQRLFTYIDDGEVRVVRSDDVNAYLRDHAGFDVTAKDYRTWMGTLLCAGALGTHAPPRTERERTAAITEVLAEVSDLLANTPRICRASYVHPVVFDAFGDGRLATRWHRPPPARPSGLTADERRLRSLLTASRGR